ncbi:MAG TPA: polysaccharide deacetylase family protein [Solirubrobacteraceae bacterium]|nr:polysaccharide deacetylase family protein [Solirubrobacteraceae bacterium]
MPATARAMPALVAVALLVAGCGSSASTSSSAATAGATTAPAQVAARARSRSVPRLIPPPGAPDRSVHVPVLTFHRVARLKPDAPAITVDLTVDPANFTAELAALHDAGYHAVSQAQLFDALYHGATLPSKPVLISVDDGYVDDVARILPALQRYHMVATFFVITGRFTMPGFLDAAQVRQLDRAGMDIGDHTAHHVDLRLLTAAELRAETLGSRRVMQRTLGHFVYAFAYPFGAEDPTVLAAVRAAGFTMAYTTAGGTTESTSAPLLMPRLHIGRAVTPSGLLALLGGA